MVARYANFDSLSTLVVFSMHPAAWEPHSHSLIVELRSAIDGLQQQNSMFALSLYGPGITETDAEAFTMQRFPWVAVLCLVLVCTIVAVRFQAALVPLKLLATMACPLLFVYGTATGIFQVSIRLAADSLYDPVCACAERLVQHTASASSCKVGWCFLARSSEHCILADWVGTGLRDLLARASARAADGVGAADKGGDQAGHGARRSSNFKF